MGDLGVFEADFNAGKISAEAAANDGFEFEKSVDRAVFRAKEAFGSYLANSTSKADFEERWGEVRPQVIKVIAQVTKPTPGVIRRVGAALRPSLPAQAPTKKNRPSSAKTATAGADTSLGTKVVAQGGQAGELDSIVRVGATQKHAWSYDQSTKLYTSNDPMQKFACPGCGTEQQHLGFSHCAGCERTWNSWPVRQAGSEKTASTYVLMAREVKMRGDQFKLAAAPVSSENSETLEKTAYGPEEPPPGVSQPGFGTMPGDNSGASGAPLPPEQPPTPVAAVGDHDNDGDIAGGVTEDSPIDQIQDALQEAIVALKDVQMLSINPALTAMGSDRTKKVATLRTAMDRFWGLHKQLNYVAGMLAKEANIAVRTVDPRIAGEAEFVAGYTAASKNEPLPAKTAKAWLEGYIAFHTQAETYDTGASSGSNFRPGSNDESNGARNEGTYLTGDGLEDTPANTSDAGPFDSSQPAQQASARQIDQDNAQGGRERGQGQSGSIQPTGARKGKI